MKKRKKSGWKRTKKMIIVLNVHPHEVEYLRKDKVLKMISKKLAEMF